GSSVCICAVPVSEGLSLGSGDGVLPDRGRVERGRQRRIHLGSLFAYGGTGKGWRHGGCRLRLLSSLQRRCCARQETQSEELSLLDFMAAHTGRRNRQTE